MKEVVIKISTLWKYKEYDREETPVNQMVGLFTGNKYYQVDSVADYICKNGMEPIELSINGNTALVTDGNHRLSAARKMGYTHIVAFINDVTGISDSVFYDHTLNRFKIIDSDLMKIIKRNKRIKVDGHLIMDYLDTCLN